MKILLILTLISSSFAQAQTYYDPSSPYGMPLSQQMQLQQQQAEMQQQQWLQSQQMQQMRERALSHVLTCYTNQFGVMICQSR